MVLQTAKIPRDVVTIRANECQNPRVASYSMWTSAGAGSGGAATDSYGSSSGTLEKAWTTAPSNVDGAGWYYRHGGWAGDYTEKVASGYVYCTDFEPNFRLYFNFWNKDGGYIGGAAGPTTQLYLSNRVGSNGIANGWQRVSGTAKCPPGTAYTDVQFVCAAGNKPAVNNRIALQRVLIEPGSAVGSYFDGTTYATGYNDLSTGWEGAADASRSLMYQIDAKTLVQPQLVIGYESTQDSRNVVHQLIDGTVTATLLPGSTRKGVLKLFFADAASADVCRAVHARSGYWSFTDDSQPTENMYYVVDGAVRKYQSENRLRWTVEIPFREIS